MISCFVILTTNVRNAYFFPKTLPPNSRSPSSTVKHYLVSKQASILVYISLNVHKSLLWRIVSACAIPIILYCSPIIFPGLLNKDFASIKTCIRLLTTSSGVAYAHNCKVLIFQRLNSCTRLSTSIINDPLHPLHPCLSNALSTFNTRSSFKLLRCRNSLHRNSLTPSLARLLVNPKQEVDLLSSNLS